MADIDLEISRHEKELQDLRNLKANLETIPEMLRQDAEKKIEQLPKGEGFLADLKWQKGQWDKIMAGDDKALKRFLESRSSHEYEQWEFIDVDDPAEYLKKHLEKVKEDYQ